LKVKVCGVKRHTDLEWLDGMVDYVGFILAPRGLTPRALTVTEARDMFAAVEKSVPVAVTAGMEVVDAVVAAEEAGAPVIQYHEPLTVEALNLLLAEAGLRDMAVAPVLLYDTRLKRWRGLSPEELRMFLEDNPGDAIIEYVLVDAVKGSPPEGPQGLRLPLGVYREAVEALSCYTVAAAGGVKPGNACLAASTGVGMIDVSSGVEEAPGAKSRVLVEKLLEELRKCGR